MSTRSLYLHSSSSFLYPLNNDNFFLDVLYVGVFNSINLSNRIYVYSCPVLLRFVQCYHHYLPFTRHMLSPELQLYGIIDALYHIYYYFSLYLGSELDYIVLIKCINVSDLIFLSKFWCFNYHLLIRFDYYCFLLLFIIILSIGKVQCSINYILVRFWDVWSWIFQTFKPRSFDCIAIYFNTAINMLKD